MCVTTKLFMCRGKYYLQDLWANSGRVIFFYLLNRWIMLRKYSNSENFWSSGLSEGHRWGLKFEFPALFWIFWGGKKSLWNSRQNNNNFTRCSFSWYSSPSAPPPAIFSSLLKKSLICEINYLEEVIFIFRYKIFSLPDLDAPRSRDPRDDERYIKIVSPGGRLKFVLPELHSFSISIIQLNRVDYPTWSCQRCMWISPRCTRTATWPCFIQT